MKKLVNEDRTLIKISSPKLHSAPLRVEADKPVTTVYKRKRKTASTILYLLNIRTFVLHSDKKIC